MTDESPVATIGPALLLSVALSLDDIKAIERYASAIRADERGKARAELEALRKDAARYRWLRDEVAQDERDRPMGVAVAIIGLERNSAGHFDVQGWAVTYDIDADAAIDSAMSTGATHEQ